MADLLIVDRNYPDCCALDLRDHVKESLGSPIQLPPIIAAQLELRWANECDADLRALFKLITGESYSEVWRDNTYNSDNDFSTFAVVTVYADNRCSDWVWRRDIFVVVEYGMGGDPRYSAYSPAEIYRLEDCCIGDTDFLEWKLSWWATPINERYDSSLLEAFNERASAGYTSYPYGEVERNVYASPIWSDTYRGFIARLKGIAFPVILTPQPPFYS